MFEDERHSDIAPPSNDLFPEISLEDPFSFESDLTSFQPSPEKLFDSSMETLRTMAARSNQDRFIYQD